MTLTCVSVTSGKASIGRDLNAANPPATNKSVPRTMNSGFCSANATMRLIIGRRSLGGRAAAQLPMQTMQEQVTFDDDFLAEFHAGCDARDAVPHGIDLHLMARVAARLVLDEYVIVVAGEHQGLLRHLQIGSRRLLELRGDEHLAFQLAFAIFDRAAH